MTKAIHPNTSKQTATKRVRLLLQSERVYVAGNKTRGFQLWVDNCDGKVVDLHRGPLLLAKGSSPAEVATKAENGGLHETPLSQLRAYQAKEETQS